MNEPRRGLGAPVLLALLASWLGWGFDVFDAHLFNYVAQPTLLALGVPKGDVNGHMAWIQSIFLVGWGVGGLAFGRLADRIGRARVLVATMVLYGGGTAACAACSSVPSFVLCRVVASLGVGGEWAAGASLLAEVAPDALRPLLGALMYTASPLGQILASAVSHGIVGGVFADRPADGWRYAYLLGLAPAVLALVLRLFVAESSRWEERRGEPVPVSRLFGVDLRRATVTGLLLAALALLGAWGVLGFLPKAVREWCELAGLTGEALEARIDAGNRLALLGGFAGTLATVAFVRLLGRRGAFFFYFAGAAAATYLVLGAGLPLDARLRALFLLGFTAHGVFGIFPYYLPELFPTGLRAAGSGFCYSFGRFASAGGVLVVGRIQRDLGLTHAMLVMGAVYVVGALTVPFARDTHGKLATEADEKPAKGD
jgi:MFS family permease